MNIKLKKEDFSDLLKNAEKVAKKMWDNKKDEIWNSTITETMLANKNLRSP